MPLTVSPTDSVPAYLCGGTGASVGWKEEALGEERREEDGWRSKGDGLGGRVRQHAGSEVRLDDGQDGEGLVEETVVGDGDLVERGSRHGRYVVELHGESAAVESARQDEDRYIGNHVNGATATATVRRRECVTPWGEE